MGVVGRSWSWTPTRRGSRACQLFLAALRHITNTLPELSSGSDRLNGQALKPIHDWVKNHERTWSERFERLDVVLEDLKQREDTDGGEQRDGDGDAPHR
jgi:hypothetical protein